ncbi:hypothetical protein K3495_g8024 [Podosphaera aphanis]|nr:hypothetical protein K3495_g8024 [Podosphaera aphanis]
MGNARHVTPSTAMSLPNGKSAKRRCIQNKDKIQVPGLSGIKRGSKTTNSDHNVRPGPRIYGKDDDAEVSDVPLQSSEFESVNAQPSLSQMQPSPLQTSSLLQTPSFPHSLSSQYDITTMSVVSSAKIHNKVVNALKVLARSPTTTDDIRNGVVMFHASSKACGKMISIVEIVKREIAEKMHGKWFQYNVLHQELKDSGPNEKENRTVDKNQEDVELSTEAPEKTQTAFERAIEGPHKVQTSLVMSIYLSRVRIESLKKIYGEQTNEFKILPDLDTIACANGSSRTY